MLEGGDRLGFWVDAREEEAGGDGGGRSLGAGGAAAGRRASGLRTRSPGAGPGVQVAGWAWLCRRGSGAGLLRPRQELCLPAVGSVITALFSVGLKDSVRWQMLPGRRRGSRGDQENNSRPWSPPDGESAPPELGCGFLGQKMLPDQSQGTCWGTEPRR